MVTRPNIVTARAPIEKDVKLEEEAMIKQRQTTNRSRVQKPSRRTSCCRLKKGFICIRTTNCFDLSHFNVLSWDSLGFLVLGRMTERGSLGVRFLFFIF
jgi:hypothetical protein